MIETDRSTETRSIRRELRGIVVLYAAIAILPILIATCIG